MVWRMVYRRVDVNANDNFERRALFDKGQVPDRVTAVGARDNDR